MYKKELENLITSKKLPKSLMLYGECDFSLSYYANLVLKNLGQSDEIRKMFYEEYSYKEVKAYLSQMSLFGGSNILYLKIDKGITKVEVENILKLCVNSHESWFIFDFRGEAKRAKELSAVFTPKNSANFVRFFKPNFSESISFLSSYSKTISLDIDNYALTHLYHTQGENLALAANELEKLKILDKKITAKEIDAFVYGLHSIDISSFVKTLMSKKDITKSIQKLLESGSLGEVEIINALQNHIVTLFLFLSYIKTYGSANSKDILGYVLPKFVVDDMANASIKIKINAYNKMLTHLAMSEMKLKESTNIDKTSYLFSSLIKLQTFL